MKKLSYLLGLLLVAGFIFTSCSDDDDTEPVDLSPTITFQTSQGLTFSDVELTAGESITIGVVASANSSSGAKLTNVKVYMIVNNVSQPDIVDTTFNESTFQAQYNITFPDPVEGKLYAEVTDKDGEKNSVSFNVTVNPGGDPVVADSDVTMGSFNDNAFGSFYSVATQTVYFKAEANNSPELIDFVFFKGASTMNSIAAPAAQNVQTVFNLNWSVYRDTKIEMASIDATDFDAIGDSYMFPEVTGTGNEVNNLGVNDVLVFETEEGVVGFIKINSFPAKGDKINIDIKMQDQ